MAIGPVLDGALQLAGTTGVAAVLWGIGASATVFTRSGFLVDSQEKLAKEALDEMRRINELSERLSCQPWLSEKECGEARQEVKCFLKKAEEEYEIAALVAEVARKVEERCIGGLYHGTRSFCLAGQRNDHWKPLKCYDKEFCLTREVVLTSKAKEKQTGVLAAQYPTPQQCEETQGLTGYVIKLLFRKGYVDQARELQHTSLAVATACKNSSYFVSNLKPGQIIDLSQLRYGKNVRLHMGAQFPTSITNSYWSSRILDYVRSFWGSAEPSVILEDSIIGINREVIINQQYNRPVSGQEIGQISPLASVMRSLGIREPEPRFLVRLTKDGQFVHLTSIFVAPVIENTSTVILDRDEVLNSPDIMRFIKGVSFGDQIVSILKEGGPGSININEFRRVETRTLAIRHNLQTGDITFGIEETYKDGTQYTLFPG